MIEGGRGSAQAEGGRGRFAITVSEECRCQYSTVLEMTSGSHFNNTRYCRVLSENTHDSRIPRDM